VGGDKAITEHAGRMRKPRRCSKSATSRSSQATGSPAKSRELCDGVFPHPHHRRPFEGRGPSGQAS
jgi:hypothetical protein